MIQTVPHIWVPPHVHTTDIADDTGFVIDADGEKVSFIVQLPKTGTLHSIGMKNGQASAPSIKTSFQDVSTTTGNPDEVVDQFRTESPSSGWFNSGIISSDGTDGGAKRSGNRGDLLAIVFEFASFGAGDSFTIYGVGSGGNQQFPGRMPYAASKISGSWTKTVKHPILALKYDDGNYYPVQGCMPVSSISAPSINVDSAGIDERALRFKFPAPVRVAGYWIRLDLDGPADIVLYDDTNTVLASASLDSDVRLSGARSWHTGIFSSSVTLDANAVYRLSVKPTSATNIQYKLMTMSSAALMAALQPGVEWYASDRLNGGTWNDDTASRILAGLILDGLEDGA